MNTAIAGRDSVILYNATWKKLEFFSGSLMYLTESTVVQVTKDSIKGYCKSYNISGELKNQA